MSLFDAAVLDRDGQADEIMQWGFRLAWALTHDGRLFTASSAAHAQHLAAELVGRMGDEPEPLPALALTTAWQVREHAVPGDVVLMLSPSGASARCVSAAEAALDKGAEPWALTGPLPNPLAPLCKRVIAVDSDDSQVVQEMHQALVHLLCECVDELLPTMRTSGVAS